MFVDQRTITIAGGRGGDGIVHWHREKFVSKGGPDGGNGGDGGDAYIVAVRDIAALARYRQDAVLAGAGRHARHRRAPDGEKTGMTSP